MARAFNKEIARSIRTTLGRFVAIAAIVALGTGFYAGLRMTAPDMNIAADTYYDGTDLMDIRVVSTLGMSDEDIEVLRGLDGVEAVMPAYETDVIATIADNQYAVRVHSLPESAQDSVQIDDIVIESDDEDYINRLSLVEGRWPEREGECVISADRVMNTTTVVGDTAVITESTSDIDTTLVTTTYTIVGFVHSSYYVSSSSMGVTSLGSGNIQQFMYVLDSNFAEDYPITEAFITVEGARDLLSGSDAYNACVAEVMDEINAIADERELARLEEIRRDAREELDEAYAEYEQARSDAYAELDDAKAELDEALAELDEGEAQLAEGQAQYDEGLAELERERASVPEQIADEIAQAEATLEEGQAQVDAAQSELDESRAALELAWEQAGMTPQEGASALEQLDEGIAQINEGIAALQQQLDALDPTSAIYPTAAAELQAQIESLEENLAELNASRDSLQELVAAQETFDASEAEAVRQIEEAQAQIDEGRAELERQRSSAEQSAQEGFDEAETQLDEALSELEQSREELDAGRQDYEEGLAEYEQARIDAEAELADAAAELADAEKEIEAIEAPSWLVMDRTKNYGAVSFSSDAERVNNIGAIFPFIFFLVAALVALTTMTRMVDEERILIGTFKALGYSRARITSKYLIYAALAGVIGSVIGIIVLSIFLPVFIMEAYSVIYYVPHGLPPIDLPIALISAGVGIGVTLIATWAAVISTLREQPAALMLPRAPKAGKRIALERIRPLWRHLSFSWKVTFRNLFRYKRRLIMTIIGIAGCSGLLLTGLGLQDSINDIIDKHFGVLVNYNVVVTCDDDMDARSQDELIDELSDKDRISVYERAQTTSMMALEQDGSESMVSLVVPEDIEGFRELWLMRDRTSGRVEDLASDGVIITEKLATTFDLSPGDTIVLATQDDMGNATEETYELTVGDIMENYLYDYVFATPAVYEQAFGAVPDYTSYYAIISEDEQVRAEFNESMREIDGVKTVAYNDETIDTYRSMLRSVDAVVIVLVVAAAALAFIVLYNLTNINICERKREIATLKVLGFLPREVDMYIYRETMILSIVGCLIGLVFGIFLERFVVITAEVDQVMFGRDIHAMSFVWAFVLTMVFTIIVMLFMHRKLSKIDMVESLKSNE